MTLLLTRKKTCMVADVVQCFFYWLVHKCLPLSDVFYTISYSYVRRRFEVRRIRSALLGDTYAYVHIIVFWSSSRNHYIMWFFRMSVQVIIIVYEVECIARQARSCKYETWNMLLCLLMIKMCHVVGIHQSVKEYMVEKTCTYAMSWSWAYLNWCSEDKPYISPTRPKSMYVVYSDFG